MLRILSGTVIGKRDHAATFMVGGFGIEVFAPAETLSALSIGVEATVFTHLALRENAAEVFGFSDPATRDFFELLLSVPGVGPRSALAILSLAPWQTIAGAVRKKDVGYLTKVAGIGKKTAEKIAIVLSDKVPAGAHEPHDTDAELLETLLALGYQERDARAALRAIPATLTERGERLRYALKKH